MFYDTKSLIVVYKDEMLLNQFKKLVETKDDPPDGKSTTGIRDDTINIISWNEKTWLEQKKAGNITNKVLFLGSIKGTDKLIPVIDEIFCEYGVHYGWAGNQAIVYADIKALKKVDDYQNFLLKLAELPVPDMIKKAKRIDLQKNQESPAVESAIEAASDTSKIKQSKKPMEIFKGITDDFGNIIEKAENDLSVFADNLFRDNKLTERQMLFYGVINLYNKGLESFMRN